MPRRELIPARHRRTSIAMRRPRQSVFEPLESRVLLAGAVGPSSGVLFQPPADYRALGSAIVKLSDVNGDGIPDLIARAGTNLSVLLGRGDGRFGPAIETTLDSRAGGITVGDFNHDGKADVVYPVVPIDQSQTPPLTGVLLGNGDGTFRAAPQLPIFVLSDEGATGDFNLDGNLDLVASSSATTLALALGKGDGTFNLTSVPSAGIASAIVVADFNGDGKPDIALAHDGPGGSGDNDVTVLLGNGDGTFSAPQKYLLPSGGAQGNILLASADLNGDGKPDLVAVDWHRNSVSVLLTNGNGTFAAPLTSQAEINPSPQTEITSILLTDLNADGKPDLVMNDESDNTVKVRLGRGDGTFQPEFSIPIGHQPYSVAAMDLNGDGRPDLVVASPNDNVISVLLSTSLIGTGGLGLQVSEGQPLVNVPLGSFESTAGPLRAGDYTAMIDWGDGSTTAGAIRADNQGRLFVSGTHTYGDAGVFSARPMLLDGHGVAASAIDTVGVADAPLTATAETASGTISTALTAIVAHFSDASPDSSASEFAATIDWGDGHTSVGTIQRTSGGDYSVLGTNTYTGTGSYTAVVTINDTGGSSTAAARSAVTVLGYQSGGGTISGNVYDDLNGDAIREVGEPPLIGWSVYLDKNNNGVADPGEPIAISSATGAYTLADVPAGTWSLRLLPPPGWRQTQPSGGAAQSVTFHTGQILNGVDFGAIHVPAAVTAANFAYDHQPVALNFTFNQPVFGWNSAGAVVINDLSTGQTVTPTSMVWDAGKYTLRVTLPASLADGNYDAILAQSAFTDGLGDHLNADPDGTGGDDYVFNFFSLAADLNHDGSVDFQDLRTLAAHYGKAGSFEDGDINGDGKVDFQDLVLLAKAFGHQLNQIATAYQFIDLTPAGFDMNGGAGIWAGQQAGGGKGAVMGGHYHALLFQGSAANVTDLNPAGYVMSTASGVFGNQQIGYGSKTTDWGAAHALLWTGSAVTFVDLNPSGAASSEANGIFGNQQVGTEYLLQPIPRYHAVLWYGTAGSAVDLNPTGYNTTFVDATSGDHQIGTGYTATGQGGHALLWSATAASVIDLNPAGYAQSDGRGVWGDQQVGDAYVAGLNNIFHAILWHGTAASAVDLNPTWAAVSGAAGTNGRQQVGYANLASGASHAVRWTGTAASTLDLQTFLPAALTSSVATAINADGDILGFASDGTRTHLVEWVPISAPVNTARATESARVVVHRRPL